MKNRTVRVEHMEAVTSDLGAIIATGLERIVQLRLTSR